MGASSISNSLCNRHRNNDNCLATSNWQLGAGRQRCGPRSPPPRRQPRALRMHRPPRSTMCRSLAMCKAGARQSSPLPQPGERGPQGLNPAFPATGVPRMRSFWQARSRLLPTCGGFRAPAVPGYEGELPQGSFGGCNVRSQGSGFPPMGPREHRCSPGSCLPHCQRGGTFTGVKHAPLSLPPALSVSLM